MLVLSGEVSEVISLEKVKEYCVVDGNDHDSLLSSYIEAVVKDGEDFTNRQFGEATYELYLEKLIDGFKLPKNPIQSIGKIEILDENNTYHVLDSSKYYLYQELEIGKIKLEEAVETIDHKRAVKITFKCGYQNTPEPIKTWISYKVKTIFDEYEDEKVAKYVENMLRKYRIGPLG